MVLSSRRFIGLALFVGGLGLTSLVGCGSNESIARAYSGALPIVSANTYSFGEIFVGTTLSRQAITVTNRTNNTFQVATTLAGATSFSLPTGTTGCNGSLAPGTSCIVTAAFAPTQDSGATPASASLQIAFSTGSTSSAAQTVTLTGTAHALAGSVTNTNNPQVALYTVQMPAAGTATVQFGQTTGYGRQTWTKSVAAAGPLSIYVAGMLPNSAYHMQATVSLSNGVSTKDTDHVFNTGAPPFSLPVTSAVTTAGMTPQPGVEQFSANNGTYYSLAITDLQGNMLWGYAMPGDNGRYSLEGAKLMSNGDFLVTIGQGSTYPLEGATAPGAIVVREIDLAGNTVKQITTGELSTKLQGKGYNITLLEFHHDVIAMPNGHWIVLSNETRTFHDLTGIPGDTTVLGDVVVDLDENMNPVWVWDEFDHMDVNRHPYLFPDWTHTNAIVYSPDDGSLIVSMRHQNWVVKVDYANGTGTGNILWHLGEEGDFKLINGVDPTDWNYAQHFPFFFSKATAGTFSLGLMDNGDDREFPTGVVCGTSGNPSCLYSTIPVYQIDESAKTATLTSQQVLPPSEYSYFGGNTELLQNGNTEYDLAGLSNGGSLVRETTSGSSPQTVWQMNLSSPAYRAYRIPSLYPGVQW